MVSQFAMKARVCVYVFPRIRQPLLRHLFSIKAVNLLLKMSHLDMYKALASASPFLTAKGDETPSKNASS